MIQFQSIFAAVLCLALMATERIACHNKSLPKWPSTSRISWKSIRPEPWTWMTWYQRWWSVLMMQMAGLRAYFTLKLRIFMNQSKCCHLSENKWSKPYRTREQLVPSLSTNLWLFLSPLLKGRVWWHALIPFLKEEGCGFLDAEIDKKILARGFKHTSKGAGFMDYQDIPDVLMWMTEGGLWKSAAVSLLREIEVGGELGNMNLGTEEDEQSRVHDEWNPPTWPKWILERWQEATDEEENPKEGWKGEGDSAINYIYRISSWSTYGKKM